MAYTETEQNQSLKIYLWSIDLWQRPQSFNSIEWLYTQRQKNTTRPLSNIICNTELNSEQVKDLDIKPETGTPGWKQQGLCKTLGLAMIFVRNSQPTDNRSKNREDYGKRPEDSLQAVRELISKVFKGPDSRTVEYGF